MTTPKTIKATPPIRKSVIDSENHRMPRMAVSAVPLPAHTAYASPTSRCRTDRDMSQIAAA